MSARLIAGHTVEVRFVDGAQVEILPRSAAVTHPAAETRPALLQSGQRLMDQTGPLPALGRALVLEPFAGELGLGPDAGQGEADALRRAGFTVTILRDSAVTLSVMQTMSQYAFVYIETHSNSLSSGGDAVIATAETDAAPYASLVADGSLKQVTVAGDSQNIYLAITGVFISRHLGDFPHDSIMFVNGCSVLNAPLFWNALQQRNVDALIGWDNEVPGTFSAEAGKYTVNQLGASDSVAGSVAATLEQGLGIGISDTGPARLGFEGDGADTLAAALGNSPAAPAATATSTPSPTATPTSTPSPTATPRKTSAVTRKHKRHSCRPGHHRVHGKCRPNKHKKVQ